MLSPINQYCREVTTPCGTQVFPLAQCSGVAHGNGRAPYVIVGVKLVSAVGKARALPPILFYELKVYIWNPLRLHPMGLFPFID